MKERTSDEIRREIERKRLEMDRTVDDLERRLTPAQMIDHALWFLRGSDTGSERAHRAVDGLVGFAKNHPMPVALMSAGAAWLAAEARSSDDVGPGTYGRAEGRVGPYMGDALDEGELRDDDGRKPGDASLMDRARDRVSVMGDRVGEAAHDARLSIHSARESASEKMHAAGDSLRESAEATRERTAELARRGREQAALRGRQARDRYEATLDENPLALGAAAFGLGLAAGLAAPSSRVESDLMGERSDAIKGEARSLATDTARKARTVGRETLEVVRREALPENIVDEVKDRVQRVASNAATAARETARTEGLDVDTLKERAKRIASDAKTAAKESARAEGLTSDALKERAIEARKAVSEPQ